LTPRASSFALNAASVRIEDKLYHNRYRVDAGKAHIKVRPHTVPSPALL
jgi:ferredoxin like protein